jgi:hypothetical protein
VPLRAVGRERLGTIRGLVAAGKIACGGYRLKACECVEGELHQNTLPLINSRKLEGWDITAMEGFFSSLNIARTTRHI